jgi:hypothetical protein
VRKEDGDDDVELKRIQVSKRAIGEECEVEDVNRERKKCANSNDVKVFSCTLNVFIH